LQQFDFTVRVYVDPIPDVCTCALLLLRSCCTHLQCILTNNTAAQGGALYGADTSVVLIDSSTFAGNHGDNAGAVVTTCNMTVLSSVFDNNTATERGGAIGVGSGLVVNVTRAVTVTNSTFLSNRAYSGAAISSETPTTADTTFSQVIVEKCL
jgi:predicted outer membrane repeat protein